LVEATGAVILFSFLPFVAGFFSLLLAAVSLVRRKPSPATWCFFAGMTALGIDSVFTGLGLRNTQLDEVAYWLTAAFIVKSLVPVIWLCFSLTYSRTNYREFLARWGIPVALLGLVPIGLSIGFHDQLFEVVPGGSPGDGWRLQFGAMAKGLNAILLIALVLILMNLEQTLRSAVGTMRWRIKFVVLALVVIFGARLYVRSQAILFSAPDMALWSVESGALLIGCVFLTLAYARTGWAEIAVYPSSAVLRSSLTVLIVGGYLLIVGVLAQVVRRFGGEELFQFQAFVVLLGMAGLAVLLLSDRARQRLHAFVVRHFRKAQHDSARVWTMFSQQLASVTGQAALCEVSAKLVSETFGVLSVTIWLLDEGEGQLVVGASTAPQSLDVRGTEQARTASSAVIIGLKARSSPFDLEDVNEPWAEELRQLNSIAFTRGGNRLCVPLRAGERSLGVVVLADRIDGAVYTVEESELLKCIGDQITSVLLNLRLASEVASAKELDAFRTMSAFFVHDLKNAAASLNLMLRNLPVHFDDPAFREDALRGIGNMARRIDDMIARLSALRHRTDSGRIESDLNQLVSEALDRVNEMPDVEVTRELQPLPRILADREQIQSVVTNLVLNARDALGSGGRIQVRTEHLGNRAVLSVMDNGCGMSQTFVKESLFRPFQSTKKKGLGIGLFQCRAIVQAHGGGMHVETEVGKGTTFLASFPVNDEP
jgi:putative PEP-CTERM system histidine kinase